MKFMKSGGFLPFLIILLALTAFLAGYIMIGRGTGAIPKTGTILDKFSGSEPNANDLQPEDEIKLSPISDRKVVSATNSLVGSQVIYFDRNGKIYEYDLEAKTEKTASDKVLPNFISAIWSPAKKEVLAIFTSETGLIFKYLNIATGKTIALNPDIRSAAFSPDGNLIAYHRSDKTDSQNGGSIMVAQPDGQYSKKVLATRINDLAMSWPTKDAMAFKTPSQEIFLLAEDGKLNKFLDIKLGLEEKWSPNGNKLIFSALSGTPDEPAIDLMVKDVASKEEKKLAQVSASKCVWSIDSATIYCAIPKSPSVDEVYSINTLDGSQKIAAEPNMPVKNLLLSTLEDYLLFISASDEKLYAIKTASY